MPSLTIVDLLTINRESIDFYGFYFGPINNPIFRYGELETFVLMDSNHNRIEHSHIDMYHLSSQFKIKGLYIGKLAVSQSPKYLKLKRMIKFEKTISYIPTIGFQYSFIDFDKDMWVLKSKTNMYTTVPLMLIEILFGWYVDGVEFDGNLLSITVLKNDMCFKHIFSVDSVALSKFIMMRG